MNQNKKSLEDNGIEKIIGNPGLQHIIEEILLNLDFKWIIAFQSVNKSCKQIVDNPIFRLRKWRLSGLLPKEIEYDMIKFIHLRKTRHQLPAQMDQNKELLEDNGIDGSSNSETQPKKLNFVSAFEKIIISWYYPYIIQEILINLDINGIFAFHSVNKSCKEIVDDPVFWLRKWRSDYFALKKQKKINRHYFLPKEIQDIWIKFSILKS